MAALDHDLDRSKETIGAKLIWLLAVWPGISNIGRPAVRCTHLRVRVYGEQSYLNQQPILEIVLHRSAIAI